MAEPINEMTPDGSIPGSNKNALNITSDIQFKPGTPSKAKVVGQDVKAKPPEVRKPNQISKFSQVRQEAKTDNAHVVVETVTPPVEQPKKVETKEVEESKSIGEQILAVDKADEAPNAETATTRTEPEKLSSTDWAEKARLDRMKREANRQNKTKEDALMGQRSCNPGTREAARYPLYGR